VGRNQLKTIEHPASCWQPDRRFWASHFFLPLMIAITALGLLETTAADVWLADRWFAFEGGEWSLRNHWLAYDVIHHHGKQLIIAIALMLVALLFLSLRSDRLRQWRRPMAYFLTCMLVLPATVAELKHFMTIPCPWSLARYGGELLYFHNHEYAISQNAGGNCFPSGHASGGFALLAGYFAAYRNTGKPWLFLLPGLLIGSLFALGQQARGAHFLSHDLATLSICWFGALGLFLLIKPCRRPVSRAQRGQPGQEPVALGQRAAGNS